MLLLTWFYWPSRTEPLGVPVVTVWYRWDQTASLSGRTQLSPSPAPILVQTPTSPVASVYVGNIFLMFGSVSSNFSISKAQGKYCLITLMSARSLLLVYSGVYHFSHV